MIDPETGDGQGCRRRMALRAGNQAKLVRPRPFGYLLAGVGSDGGEPVARPGSVGAALERRRADRRGRALSHRHGRSEAKKDDVRRNDEEGSVDILKLETQTESAMVSFHRGDFYVPLDQPLANVVIAAARA